jgi:cyclase
VKTLSASVRACFVLGALVVAHPAPAQGTLPITKLAPDVYLIVAPSGNMVAATSASGIVLAGAQSRAATPAVVAALRSVSAAPIRYVLFAPGDSMGDEGDAGWSDRHATVVAHERMRMTAPNVISAIGFSEVLQLYLDGGSIHAVHQPPGHTRADIIVHFENRKVLYLGNAFVAKGYPRIEVKSGASIDSLIKEVTPFAGFEGVQIVPGRGAVQSAADVGAYRDMLTGVRAKVAALVAENKSLADVIAAKPTAQWDATYARGGTPADRFVESVYTSLKH